MQDNVDDRAAAGRDALRRHAWHEAFQQLSAANAAQPLPPEELERLAEASFWVGRIDDAIAARERAHASYLERGDRRRAGFMASRAEIRTFMFTDIVRSTQLVEAIGDEAWADLVRWHDQALRALFAAHGGEEVDHAGDGFFVAFATTRAALECSVAIQRALLEHRRQQGFATGPHRPARGAGAATRRCVSRQGRARGGAHRRARRSRRDPGEPRYGGLGAAGAHAVRAACRHAERTVEAARRRHARLALAADFRTGMNYRYRYTLEDGRA